MQRSRGFLSKKYWKPKSPQNFVMISKTHHSKWKKLASLPKNRVQEQAQEWDLQDHRWCHLVLQWFRRVHLLFPLHHPSNLLLFQDPLCFHREFLQNRQTHHHLEHFLRHLHRYLEVHHHRHREEARAHQVGHRHHRVAYRKPDNSPWIHTQTLRCIFLPVRPAKVERCSPPSNSTLGNRPYTFCRSEPFLCRHLRCTSSAHLHMPSSHRSFVLFPCN